MVCHYDLERCCGASGRLEKQNQESCVGWGMRLQQRKQKRSEESFPGRVGEGKAWQGFLRAVCLFNRLQGKTGAAPSHFCCDVSPASERGLGSDGWKPRAVGKVVVWLWLLPCCVRSFET